MTDDDRRRVLAALPSEIERTSPPEGDQHRLPKERARETLDEFFRRTGRSVYLGSELPVYYPDEPVFAPDLIAVLDVPTHPRDHWMVSAEKRGIDFALEIHVAGDRTKDFERNVERYARLGISEYFVFEPPRGRLLGYRLSPSTRSYQVVVPQRGLWRSEVLGLDLALDAGALRFFHGSAALLDARGLIDQLSGMVDHAVRRAEEGARRAEQEAQRAEQAEARADRLAARLRALGEDPDAGD